MDEHSLAYIITEIKELEIIADKLSDANGAMLNYMLAMTRVEARDKLDRLLAAKRKEHPHG